jgi:hypothetical protein
MAIPIFLILRRQKNASNIIMTITKENQRTNTIFGYSRNFRKLAMGLMKVEHVIFIICFIYFPCSVLSLVLNYNIKFYFCSLVLFFKGDKIIHQYTLSYGTVHDSKSFIVCKEVWAYFHNTSEYRIKMLSDAYKSDKSAIGASINKNGFYSDSTNHNTTVDELKAIYAELGLQYNLEMLQMGALQPHEFDTFFWFRDHFELIGDPMPNTAGEVHIDKTEKQEIYCLYVNEVRQNCLTFSAWNKFWKRCFSNVKIRKWKNVSGKCDDCAAINNGRLIAKSQEEAKSFRKIHLMHKSGLYMQERFAYYRRRNEAKANPESILSIIIDTMDNNHCSVPYLGVNDTFGSPIHQGILGCFAHNTGNFTIYRTIGIYSLVIIFSLKQKNNNIYLY